MLNQFLFKVGLFLVASTTILVTIDNLAKVTSAQAVQLADGTVSFVNPPRLLNAVTTQKTTNMWGARYYFTLTVPENAGESLQQVTIAQGEGLDRIEYDLQESMAIEGTHEDRGQKLKVREVTVDRQTKTVTINFDPPVSPGKTVTIGLSPVRNPQFSGVYLFGVTAFPSGEKVRGQFLGYGRLHFYGDRGVF